MDPNMEISVTHTFPDGMISHFSHPFPLSFGDSNPQLQH